MPSSSDARKLATDSHVRHPFGDDRPVVGGVVGHEVEALADRLQRASEHPQIAQLLALFVLRHRELERSRIISAAMRSRPPRLGGRRALVSVSAGEGDPLAACPRGVVGELVIVPGDAFAGRADRVERCAALDVVVGDLVDLRHAVPFNGVLGLVPDPTSGFRDLFCPPVT